MTGTRRIALLTGSPHAGAGARIADHITDGVVEGGGEVVRIDLAHRTVAPCDACDACVSTGECIIDDDFGAILATLDRADALVVVSPVYFAGPPAQLKAFYDRLQVRWVRRYVLGEPAAVKRPAYLCVTRTGQDPFGFEPLVTITRSAMNIAGFHLEEVRDLIGYGGDAVREKGAARGRGESGTDGMPVAGGSISDLARDALYEDQMRHLGRMLATGCGGDPR